MYGTLKIGTQVWAWNPTRDDVQQKEVVTTTVRGISQEGAQALVDQFARNVPGVKEAGYRYTWSIDPVELTPNR